MTSNWGPWRLNKSHFVLYCDEYQVDLEQCLSSAQILDWLCQVAHKTWATDHVTGLLAALDDILNIQGTLCSDGQCLHLSRQQLRARVRNYHKFSS
jgi:hypothetical protein